tara:strand:- start:911 stop:2035 length:1125 start_codon:yes stop_codon:yes gene_type:complete
MKKAITICIPEPCHEDWNKMTPTDKGKFCSECTKEVFDFTKVTDEELVKRVANNEKVCGRFNSSQLNREMKLERKSGFSLAPVAASFLLPFTLFASSKKENTKKDTPIFKEYKSLYIGSLHKVAENKMQITTTGKIVDENGKPISNVIIYVKNTELIELSGLRGDYKIKSANDEILVFEKEGFISQEIIIKRNSEIRDIVLKKVVITFLVGKISSHEKDSVITKKQDLNKITIKGAVVDDAGLPLPGVNIIVKGTTIGTQTDFDGNYKLEAEKEQILIFSYVGFKTEEVTLSNINNKIDLQMQMSEELMGEIIVLGYAVTDDSSRLMGYTNSNYDSEPTEWREKAQTSLDNEKEFSRIKREQKKEARLQKRKNK